MFAEKIRHISKTAATVGLTGLTVMSGVAPAVTAIAEPDGTSGSEATAASDGTGDGTAAAKPRIMRVAASPNVDAGKVLIHSNGVNDNMTYNVYKIFSGNCRGDNKISELAWKDDATRKAVVGVIEAVDPDYKDPDNASESAQKAAEYIATHIGDSDGTKGGTKPSQSDTVQAEGGTFADKLSDAVDNLPVDSSVKAGVASDKVYADGYYLIVSDTDSIDAGSRRDQTGTSPIFCVLGRANGGVEVTEKTDTVTVDKKVKEDSTGSWGNAADQDASKPVEYQLMGTLPSNLNSFKDDGYFYAFHDSVSKGLTVDKGSVRVYATKSDDLDDQKARVDVTDAFTVAYDDLSASTAPRNLTVTCNNILDATNATLQKANVDSSTKFVVEYTATLNPDDVEAGKTPATYDANHAATIGAQGNPNSVYVEYTKNPNHPGMEGHGTTHTKEVKTYTYQLKIHKQDKQNAARSLKGAKFTIQVKQGNTDASYTLIDGTKSSSEGKYLQKDGSLGDSAYEFETDADGNFTVPRIDEGVYTVHEVKAPLASENNGKAADGTDASESEPGAPTSRDVYDLVPDFTLTIGSNVSDLATKDSTAQNLALSAKIDGTWRAIGSSDAQVAFGVDANGAKLNEDGTVANDQQRAGSGVNSNTGTITVVVRDQKETLMPLTGIPVGVFVEYAVGLGAITIGVAGYLYAHKRKASKGGQAAA